MSATHHHPGEIPRGVGLALLLLLAFTLLAVAAVRWSGVPTREPDAATISERSLRFEDRADGSVSVVDHATGQEVQRVQGEAGFLRGALRALTRERHARGIGQAAPFLLSARADGRLTLSDPQTGARLDLESFGPANAGVFARLLTPPPR